MNKYWRIVLRCEGIPDFHSEWMDEDRARKQAAITAMLWVGEVFIDYYDGDVTHKEQIK